MPAEDAMRIDSPWDAALQSGMADSIVNAARNGEDIFALFSDSTHMHLGLPSLDDMGANLNFLEGSGHTAVAGDGFFLVNATQERITPSVLVGADAVIRRLEQVGTSNLWEFVDYIKFPF